MVSGRGTNASPEPTPADLLHLDIDLRIGVDVWSQLWEAREWDYEMLGAVLRFVYGLGYYGALTEDQRGKLCRDHGLPVPTRGRRKIDDRSV